jgi:peptide/nickel transport system substrate-binding protein
LKLQGQFFFYFTGLIILVVFLVCKNTSNSFLNYGIQNAPNGLDPVKDSEMDAEQIYSQIYETLVCLDFDGERIQPKLAREWSVNKDYTLFTFQLRSGIKFHDGTKLTAEAAKNSYLRQIRLNNDSPLFNQIESINVKDSLSIEIKMKSPAPIFLYNLTSPLSLIAISNKLLNNSNSEIAYHPIGTGPYKFDGWDDHKFIRLSQFDDYWDQKSKIKNIYFKFFDSKFEREEALINNKVDLLYGITGFNVDRLKWLGKIDYKLVSPYSTSFLGFNLNDPILKNKKFRKAILHCINIPSLVLNFLRGNSIIAKGPLPPSLYNYDTVSQDSFNLDQARKLLGESGIKGKLKFKLFYPKEAFVRYAIPEYIKANLAKIGISSDLIPYDTWEEHNIACKSNGAQLFISGWASDVLGDPENFLYSLFYSISESNYFHYNNPKVDHWLDEAAREPNREERNKVYQKIVNTILDDIPAVFLYHPRPHIAYNKEKIKYLPVNPYGIIQFNRIILNED